MSEAKLILSYIHIFCTQSELSDAKLILKKSEAQLQEELRQRKETAGHVVRLNNQIKMIQTQKQNAPQLTRKVSNTCSIPIIK